MKLYSELAVCWSILTPQGTYDHEAQFFYELLSRPKNLLELGSGIGAIVESLTPFVSCTLVDQAPEMLKYS